MPRCLFAYRASLSRIARHIHTFDFLHVMHCAYLHRGERGCAGMHTFRLTSHRNTYHLCTYCIPVMQFTPLHLGVARTGLGRASKVPGHITPKNFNLTGQGRKQVFPSVLSPYQTQHLVCHVIPLHHGILWLFQRLKHCVTDAQFLGR